jgi:hypothetical protein
MYLQTADDEIRWAGNALKSAPGLNCVRHLDHFSPNPASRDGRRCRKHFIYLNRYLMSPRLRLG